MSQLLQRCWESSCQVIAAQIQLGQLGQLCHTLRKWAIQLVAFEPQPLEFQKVTKIWNTRTELVVLKTEL